MRRSICIVASVLLLGGSSALAQAQSGTAGDLVISDVTVVSPERAVPLEHAYVLIRDGRIAEVSSSPLTAPRAIDGAGRYLIPGLIDSHVHLGEVPGMRAEDEAAHPELAALARAQMPRSFLYFGFTTVIDLIGEPERIARWNEADLRPDAHFCGAAPVAGGYPLVFLPEELWTRAAPYLLYDESRRDQVPAGVDPAAQTPTAVVERMAEDGAVCVKAFYETGFGGMHDLTNPTLEMLRELVAAAQARGVPVLLHANSKAAQEFAIEAGVDIIAHGLWNGLQGDDGTAEAAALLRSIADGGIGYQPTFQVLPGEIDLLDPNYLNDPSLAHSYPAALIDWYRSREGGWFRDQFAARNDGVDARVIYDLLLHRLGGIVGALDDSGALLLFGSDTPSAPTYANPPGLNGLLEMRHWIAAGVREGALFRALTIENARAFGLDRDIGTIEPGKIAHLLLLRENPLETVDAYDTIEVVIVGGEPVQRERLSARGGES
jgi:imidazolonepropionase-like amidohydrolase